MGVDPVTVGGVELPLVRYEVHDLRTARVGSTFVGVPGVVTLNPSLRSREVLRRDLRPFGHPNLVEDDTRQMIMLPGRLQKLDQILAGRGYSDADIDGIFHGNWLRFFRTALPAE